ncbi:hypothetical protein ACTXG6_39570 [Pseudonocardia sp. Cha107L01]|uniref:hypothetical protein n=1 Tax=Pseudonocardia sp. Cha107L01 TaxID=3457576 RepID=UPI00403E9585
MSGHNNNSTDQAHPTTAGDYDMVIFDRYPSEALAETRRRLVWALARLVLDLVYLTFVIVHYREGAALLDSAAGHWGWLIAGAVAGMFLLDELPDAASTAGRASEEFLRVRAYARHVLAMPLEQRLLVVFPAAMSESGEVAPAGLAVVEDGSAGGEQR